MQLGHHLQSVDSSTGAFKTLRSVLSHSFLCATVRTQLYAQVLSLQEHIQAARRHSCRHTDTPSTHTHTQTHADVKEVIGLSRAS